MNKQLENEMKKVADRIAMFQEFTPEEAFHALTKEQQLRVKELEPHEEVRGLAYIGKLNNDHLKGYQTKVNNKDYLLHIIVVYSVKSEEDVKINEVFIDAYIDDLMIFDKSFRYE